jgi:hypothetical protein
LSFKRIFRPDDNPRWCELCQIELQSDVLAVNHYAGKNHLKKRRLLQRQKPSKKVATGTPKTSQDVTPGSFDLATSTVKPETFVVQTSETQTSEKVPAQTSEIQTSEKVVDQTSEKVAAQPSENFVDQTSEKVVTQASDKVVAETSLKFVDQTFENVVAQTFENVVAKMSSSSYGSEKKRKTAYCLPCQVKKHHKT